jgi:O-acetyl-ADP-ribose deacetylase (regulator of RNase III)
MITFTQGNLLDAQVEAVVNTVNTVGVMGKGIALMFREAYPENYKAYEAACKRGEVVVGKMFVTENHDLTGPRYIINFPTKKHWIHPSRLEYVVQGLEDLVRVVRERRIRSIALPPLGCGNGGLDWGQVRKAIESALEGLDDVKFIVFEPTSAYQNTPKKAGVENMSPARAMLVELVRRYLILGFECTNLEVQKLAYFLQRCIVAKKLQNPLKLEFKPNKYGPYADNLRQLLNALDGSYLHCEKRLADAGPMEPISVDFNKVAAVQEYLRGGEMRAYSSALNTTEQIIDGFETPYLMELLSTVDWIQAHNAQPLDTSGIAEKFMSWPGGKDAARRKKKLFPQEVIELARQRLCEHRALLYSA